MRLHSMYAASLVPRPHLGPGNEASMLHVCIHPYLLQTAQYPTLPGY